jgi:RNA polymerase sigma factor (sigma-70 family)
MPTTATGCLLRYLCRAAGDGPSDAALLESYTGHADPDAFAALVRRHGPMVWGVCRRLLRDPHDADDAFQATFLVLVHKAGSIAPRHAVGNWLYGVAYRTALKARAAASRRRAMERRAAERRQDGRAAPPEPAPLLYHEIHRLPEKYRAVFVLCDLECKTRKEAARELGWPEGTVAGRLVRARALLARRLKRYGLSAALATLGTASAGTARASVGASTPRAVSLAGAVIRSMGLVKLRAAAAMLLASLGVATLTYAAAGRAAGSEADAPPARTAVGQEPARRTWPPTPTADQLVAYLNDSARKVRSLKCSDMYLDCRSGRESVSLNANFLYRRPGSFRIIGIIAGLKAFDIGCNERECWYWSGRDGPPDLRPFPLRPVAGDDNGWQAPCRPEWLLESAGLAVLDPAKPRGVIARPDTYELVEKSELVGGKAVSKVTVFHKAPAPVQVAERLVRDAHGEVLCRAVVHDVFTDPGTGATLLRKVEWEWPARRLKVVATVRQADVNVAMDEEDWRRVFRCPDVSRLPPDSSGR